MSEIPQNPAGMPDDDQDTGPPISALRELQHDTSPLFWRRVRHRIYRRQTASEIISASWEFPRIVFMELAGILINMFSANSARKGNRR
jgi:hypothetical protein